MADADPIRAAGIMFHHKGKALFLKRGPGGDHPGEWCFPGGQVEEDEDEATAAIRETKEETGYLPGVAGALHTRQINNGVMEPPVDFTTFLQEIDDQFEPTLSDEHVGHAWAPLDDPPEPLHPGVRIALARMTMDELGVAQAIASGQLISPQRYMNMTLFAMRITGTGTAYRSSLNEWVYRRPENYLTPEFLARCNGLPVILMHPDKAVLNSEEYSTRNVGSMFLPYLQGDEVWGVAKIWDADAIALLESQQLSTSPGVVLGTGSTKVTLDDGSTLLIEGKAALPDHLAICERGVWDKGGEPTGVRAEIRGDSDMTEEEKKAAEAKAAEEAKKKADAEAEEKAKADAAKADADAGEKLDKLLTGLDSLCKRMDAWDDEKKKADATKKDDMPSETEQLAADKAKKDAEEAARKDSEEKARKDAQAEVDKKIADAIKDMPKSMMDADYGAMADAQARADTVYASFGNRAPPPLQGETPIAYRRRLAKPMQKHSKAWSEIDLAALPENALAVAEGIIFADAVMASRSADGIPAGTLIERTRVTPTGHRVTEFHGPQTFISQLKLPSRRASRLGIRKDA